MSLHWLNAFIGFISPLGDPDDEEENTQTNEKNPENLNIPHSDANEEFKPFLGKVHEVSLW